MLEVGRDEFGGQRHDEVHHLQGPSPKEKEDISNITVRKRPKANIFHPFTILLWTIRCYSEPLFIPQVDDLVKTSERSLLASFSAFFSVGKCLLCNDHDLKYLFLVCMRKERGLN